MMTTYAEAIAAKREQREEISAEIELLREKRSTISKEILALELAINPPKRGKAMPDDVIMSVEPAILKASPKGSV